MRPTHETDCEGPRSKSHGRGSTRVRDEGSDEAGEEEMDAPLWATAGMRRDDSDDNVISWLSSRQECRCLGINVEKMREMQGLGEVRRGKEENEKRRNGQPRVARLAAGGSNCVINLKVRSERERENRGRERERDNDEKGGARKRERKREGKTERERATSECCRSVFAAHFFAAHRVYTCETTARTRNCR